MQLVKDKVSEVVLMGGRWDKTTGREYNFFAYKLNREAAAFICEHCPVPVTFLGYEVGKDVVTGGKEVPGLRRRRLFARLRHRYAEDQMQCMRQNI